MGTISENKKGYLSCVSNRIMTSYTSDVAKSHKKFTTALNRAKTRQACLNAYWKHKKEHENLLKKHLKEELADVNKKKAKIPFR